MFLFNPTLHVLQPAATAATNSTNSANQPNCCFIGEFFWGAKINRTTKKKKAHMPSRERCFYVLCRWTGNPKMQRFNWDSAHGRISMALAKVIKLSRFSLIHRSSDHGHTTPTEDPRHGSDGKWAIHHQSSSASTLDNFNMYYSVLYSHFSRPCNSLPLSNGSTKNVQPRWERPNYADPGEKNASAIGRSESFWLLQQCGFCYKKSAICSYACQIERGAGWGLLVQR